MIVAQVITLFLPEFVGGATLVCAEAARGLRARGHTVEVFCGTPSADAVAHGTHTWEVDGIPVTAVDAGSGYVILDTRSYRHPEVTPHFERFLDHLRPDVVHLHSIQALGTTVIDAAVARGIPVVLTMHDWWWVCARLFLVDAEGFVCAPRVDSARCHCAPGFDLVARRRELTRALGLVTRILTPSRVLADSAIANGVDSTRVEVCPNGIASGAAGAPTTGASTAGSGSAAMPPRRRRRPGPVRFGYVGGPDNRAKGLPTLLAAADRLEVGGWTLSLFGVSPGAARVPVAIFDRVRHLPAFAPAKRAEALAELDVLVVPSLMRESYSLITREALAAGVPVVASDSGGPQEVLHDGLNGFTVATAEPAALASAMARIVRDPALRERLAAGATATPLPTHAAHLDQLERIYYEVVKEAPAASSHPAAGGTVTAVPRDDTALAAQPDIRRAPQVSSLRRVLFISGIDGAPFRYRVTHLRDQLRARGIASAALYYTDPVIPAAIELADVVIAYRLPMSPWVAHWIVCARAVRRPVVFSCDDLVFDPDAAPQDALALLPEPQRAGWLAHTERYHETLVACDAFIGTTAPLVAAAARAGVGGTVVRNGLGAAELTLAETARHRAVSRRHDGVRLVYASGTIMHDLDFAVIEPALAAVLQDHPEVRLVLIGYLRTGPALAPFATRIERAPFAPWPQLMRLFADADVNVAPLRSDPFSDAKSEVKYLEAGAVGVPTVASPTWAFRQAVRPGSNGLLAATHEEWVKALGSLIVNAGLRRRLGNAARDDVFLHAGPETQADALVTALTAIRDSHLQDRPGASRQVDVPDLVETTGLDEIGRYDLEPADARPGAGQSAHDDYSPILVAGGAVGQIFTPDSDALYRIDLRVAADRTGMLPALAVHLAADATHRNPILRHTVIPGGRVAQEAWIAAEFTPLDGAAPRSLYVWVELADPAANAPAIRLRTYQQGWGEGPPTGLHLQHQPAPGSLTFRTFSRSVGAGVDARSKRSGG